MAREHRLYSDTLLFCDRLLTLTGFLTGGREGGSRSGFEGQLTPWKCSQTWGFSLCPDAFLTGDTISPNLGEALPQSP